MKSILSIAVVIFALVAGFALGVAFARPRLVHAASGVRVQRVVEGMNNNFTSGTILGFACNQQNCYILTRE